MQRKKVMFYLPTLNAGGAERVTMNILRYLDSNKYEIHLVMVSKIGDFLEYIPSYVIVHDLGTSRTIYSICKLRAIIKRVEPVFVYSTLIRTHIALDMATIGMKDRVKSVMRMPTSPKLMLQNKMINSFWRFFLEKALQKSDLVLAQTPEMKEEIISYHKVKESNVEIVMNILDTDLIDESIHHKVNPLEENVINVIASGSIQHLKGFDILIKAFAKVNAKNNKFRLSILGNDYQGKRVEYEELIVSLGLVGIVKFLGHQNNPYIYYAKSNLFVLSSRHEGLPNVVLENLYLNTPVIATRCVPFMDTIIKDGQNGFLVEVEEVDTLALRILDYEQIKDPRLIISNDYLSIDELFEKN